MCLVVGAPAMCRYILIDSYFSFGLNYRIPDWFMLLGGIFFRTGTNLSSRRQYIVFNYLLGGNSSHISDLGVFLR
jgi:hypothetical protein